MELHCSPYNPATPVVHTHTHSNGSPPAVLKAAFLFITLREKSQWSLCKFAWSALSPGVGWR